MTDKRTAPPCPAETTGRQAVSGAGGICRRLVILAGIVALGLALYLPGLNWGLPGVVSWSQDTIAGMRTLGAVAGWPDEWRGRYPPLHYLILDTSYVPILHHWASTGEAVTPPDTALPILKEPHAPKIGRLLLRARTVSLLMAVLAGIGIHAAARRITGDDLAAILAAVTLMTGASFVYFAHLGNVDVPSICWFAWSVYFYIRAIGSRRWQDCLWLGLFASLAISTKDGMAGVYPGMAMVLLVLEVQQQRASRSPLRAVASALLQPRWLVGLVAFALPYLFINGVFANPDAYVNRMNYWLDASSDTLHAQQHRYPTQFHLLLATIRYAAGAVGWPMLTALTASTVYALWKHRRTALILLVPAISYYAIVIAQIDFVYSRFLLAPLALTGMLGGIAGADLYRSRRLPGLVRLGVPVVVISLTLGYAVAIDVAMINDSRYEAEAWFAEHVEPPSSVGAFPAHEELGFKAQYLPRVLEMGYATYPVPMREESFGRPQPEYLILTSYNYEDFDGGQGACMRRLIRGDFGYKMVATFTGRHLGTGSSWLSLAGWAAPTPGKINPTIVILKRAER